MVQEVNINSDIKELQNQIKKLTIKVGKLEKNDDNKKKSKKEKDEKSPKRNVNCYIHFYNEFFKEYSKKNTGLKAIEIGKIAGNEWKQLKQDPKKKENI